MKKKNEQSIPKTYGAALAAGYSDGDQTWERGYISRKSKLDDLPVKVAGGNRKGNLYVLLPAYTSTQYCIRQYLVKK